MSHFDQNHLMSSVVVWIHVFMKMYCKNLINRLHFFLRGLVVLLVSPERSETGKDSLLPPLVMKDTNWRRVFTSLCL